MIHPRENLLFESSRITIFAGFDVLGVDCGVVFGAGVPAEVRSTTAYGENDVVRALIALSFPTESLFQPGGLAPSSGYFNPPVGLQAAAVVFVRGEYF
jgi:hypothetical protein